MLCDLSPLDEILFPSCTACLSSAGMASSDLRTEPDSDAESSTRSMLSVRGCSTRYSVPRCPTREHRELPAAAAAAARRWRNQAPSSFLSAAPVETEAGLGLQRRTRRTSEQLLSAVACRVFWECLRLTHQLFDCSLRSATTITALAHSRSCAPQSRDPRRSCRPGCAARADCCVEPEASPRRAGSRRAWLASWSWRHQKTRQHAFSAVWAAASLWQRRWSAPAASA